MSAYITGGGRGPLVWITALVSVLLAEGFLLGLLFDGGALRGLGGPRWLGYLARVSEVPQVAIAAATAALILWGDRVVGALRGLDLDRAPAPARWSFGLLHVAAFALFVSLSALVLGGNGAPAGPLVALWGLVGVLMTAALVSATLGAGAARVLARKLAPLLGAATIIGLAASYAGYLTGHWWYTLRTWTFGLVQAMLGVVVNDPVSRPMDYVLGTEWFTVEITRPCSGYEGIGLIWVFLVAYGWVFRDTLRFPQALLLLPIGTVVVWLANALRITALIVVGDRLSPDVALGGFHSYAGSLLFCATGFIIAAAARRSAFFSRLETTGHTDDPGPDVTINDTAAYLVPFLTTLAVALVLGAMSAGGFDLLYPVRVLATGVVLWCFRERYAELHVTWSWPAVGIGVAVFGLWIALEPATARADPGPLPAALSALPASVAAVWLGFRVLGAVVTVPLAESLAFRGYLMRRVVAAEFRGVSLRRLSWTGVLISSVLFGAMHHRLLAGTLAGLAYAFVVYRRGELSDGVVAHATTNALLAGYVVATGSWGFWN